MYVCMNVCMYVFMAATGMQLLQHISCGRGALLSCTCSRTKSMHYLVSRASPLPHSGKWSGERVIQLVQLWNVSDYVTL